MDLSTPLVTHKASRLQYALMRLTPRLIFRQFVYVFYIMAPTPATKDATLPLIRENINNLIKAPAHFSS